MPYSGSILVLLPFSCFKAKKSGSMAILNFLKASKKQLAMYFFQSQYSMTS